MLATIEQTADLATLIALSLGSDRGRWWADANLGSDLYRYLEGGKLSTTTSQDWQQSCKQALQWLVDDGLVAKVEVRTERCTANRLNYHITLTTTEGEKRQYAL